MKKAPFILCILSSVILQGQVRNQSTLTIDRIMQGEDFVGYLPEKIAWSEDSKLIYFDWNPDMDTLRSTYQVDLDTRETRKLAIEELRTKSERGEYTRDYNRKVYENNGDLFLMDLSDFSTRQITSTLRKESNPRFSGDGKSVVYREGNNLYAWNIEDGSTMQLTNFVQGTKSDKKPDAQDLWLERDQLKYFSVLDQRKSEEDAKKHREELLQADRPEAIYLGSRRIRGMSVSPDMRYVVYQLVVEAKNKPTIVPDYVTRTGYTEELRSRPKVGAPLDSYETWILDLEADSSYRVDTKQIKGIYDKPAYLKEYAPDPETYSDKYDEPRGVIIGMPQFSEEGKALVNISAQDYKDRWIMLMDLPTGKLKMIDRQHDDAWIGGPGIGWMDWPALGWIDPETIWFKSEKTGFAHLYSANVNSGKIRALTQGDFEIMDVSLSRDRKTFYIISNKESPHEHHFYHLPSGGGRMIREEER